MQRAAIIKIIAEGSAAGEGLLQQKYERLKPELRAKGTFRSAAWRSVCSGLCGGDHLETGAALHDILHDAKAS
ncbi:hypothetical protein KCP76_02305 [Salmonella enterica subsp. enterica serovar Weltevreden]|nr:hypothetical protein KCP76_02305 [Salmonella enterica subsp. enterica serovar Weltevreden]